MTDLIKQLRLPGYDLDKEQAIQRALAKICHLTAEVERLQAKIAEMEKQWGYVPAHQQADPIKDEREAFREWFEGEQGIAYDGLWSFAKAAWLARAALGAKP